MVTEDPLSAAPPGMDPSGASHKQFELYDAKKASSPEYAVISPVSASLCGSE